MGQHFDVSYAAVSRAAEGSVEPSGWLWQITTADAPEAIDLFTTSLACTFTPNRCTRIRFFRHSQIIDKLGVRRSIEYRVILANTLE